MAAAESGLRSSAKTLERDAFRPNPQHRQSDEASPFPLSPLWADQIEYWHIDDIDCAPPDEALPILEQTIRELVAGMRESAAATA